jgi:hypothetical protein
MRKHGRRKNRILLTFFIIAFLTISSIGAIYFLGDQNANPQNSPAPSTSTSSSPVPSYTVTTPQPTSTPTFQVKILNKQIPPGYVMGFPIDSELINGMNVELIQSTNEKISIRFTAKLSGTATKLAIYAYALGDQIEAQVGLQGDSLGKPSGQWISENAFGTTLLESGSGFKTVNLQSQVALTKGQVYHLVIEAADTSLNGIIAINTYQGKGYAQPFNPEDPDIVWDDAQMNTLLFNGANWQERNKMPIFVVIYSNGASEGQPYSLAPAPWVLYGSTYVGQKIIPASDYKVGKISFALSIKANQPKDKLYYQIRDLDNVVLSEGVFADLGQLTTSNAWVETSLATPITLKAGQLYRIFIMSPQTTYDNAYYLYGHEFCYDPAIGYGGLQHQLTSSLDGGTSWGDNPDADAIFKITTVG